MSEQKTHAEIIEEMRTKAECAKPYDDGIVMMLTDFADRLDAAHKREVEATAAKCCQLGRLAGYGASEIKHQQESVGNAAKLREVVGDLLYMAERYVKKTPATESVIFDAKTKKEIRTVNYYDVIAKAQAALATPPRNCDLYADEQSAWEAFSEKRQGPDSSTEEYEQWLFEKATA